MTRVIIKRKNQWLNRMRGIGLYLDDTKLAVIGNGEIAEFEISEGTHKLRAKIDWCRSNEHSFTVPENGSHTVTLGTYKYANTLTGIEVAILIAHLVARSVYGISYLIWFVIPFFAVNLYYLTLGYKSFLVIEEDKLSFSF
jgi:hypothetical protein